MHRAGVRARGRAAAAALSARGDSGRDAISGTSRARRAARRSAATTACSGAAGATGCSEAAAGTTSTAATTATCCAAARTQTGWSAAAATTCCAAGPATTRSGARRRARPHLLRTADATARRSTRGDVILGATDRQAGRKVRASCSRPRQARTHPWSPSETSRDCPAGARDHRSAGRRPARDDRGARRHGLRRRARRTSTRAVTSRPGVGTRPARARRSATTSTGRPGASGYFSYFGAAAGEPGKGYYSYTLGAWHVVALNSNCARGRRLPGRLRAGALAARRPRRTSRAVHASPTCTIRRSAPGTCTAAAPAVQPLLRALQDDGAELVLSGTRPRLRALRPPDGRGGRERRAGVRQFVVGTGGRPCASSHRSPSRTARSRDRRRLRGAVAEAARGRIRLAVRGPARQLPRAMRAPAPAAEVGAHARPRAPPNLKENHTCLKQ